jgi:hypothetical protein
VTAPDPDAVKAAVRDKNASRNECTLAMVRELALACPPGEGAEDPGTGGKRLVAALLGNPGLLEDEVWRLFTVPGVDREMRRNRFRRGLSAGTCWAEALARLAAQGHLDRGRLLDACLDSFLRDFPPNQVSWYAAVHDQLDPSAAEMAARSRRYLALLSAPGKPGLVIGQQGCRSLLDAGLLDVPAFLAASAAPLMHPQKSVVTVQLRLIGQVAARYPALRDSALAAAAQAFDHPREDLQAAALALIDKHGVPASDDARTTITELAALLSPALRPEAAALGLFPRT